MQQTITFHAFCLITSKSGDIVDLCLLQVDLQRWNSELRGASFQVSIGLHQVEHGLLGHRVITNGGSIIIIYISLLQSLSNEQFPWMVDYLRELHCPDVIHSYLEVMMKMNSLAMAMIRIIGNSIWKSLPLCLRQPIPPGRHGICHKWHKWHLCKMILGVGNIFKNWRDKLPILWNLPNSGQSFHKITRNWTQFVLE